MKPFGEKKNSGARDGEQQDVDADDARRARDDHLRGAAIAVRQRVEAAIEAIEEALQRPPGAGMLGLRVRLQHKRGQGRRQRQRDEAGDQRR